MKIDTHAHLNHPLFDKDREKIKQKCLDESFYVINIGTNLKSSQEVVELTNNEHFFATVGLHPQNLKTGVLRKKVEEENSEKMENIFDYNKYKELASHKKVVAIGEVGLDYYWKPKTTKRKKIFKEKQKDLLLKQLKLAKELSLPVVFHCRMANQDLIKLLKENIDLKPEQAVMHCFVGTEEELKSFLGFGFYIGLNGIIFKTLNNIDFKKIIQKTPLNRILGETDCPFLTPPQKQKKRNEPFFVKHVLERIAEIKNMAYEEVLKITFENAQKMFKI